MQRYFVVPDQYLRVLPTAAGWPAGLPLLVACWPLAGGPLLPFGIAYLLFSQVIVPVLAYLRPPPEEGDTGGGALEDAST